MSYFDYFKQLEASAGLKLQKMPYIIRIDGKAFHTFTRDCVKPFDSTLSACMTDAMMNACTSIQDAVAGYTQSDEISILCVPSDNDRAQAWFDGQTIKICTVAASMVTAAFVNACNSKQFKSFDNSKKLPAFDARCHNVPQDKIVDYFRWRYNDAVKNSISSLARAHFSHKQLQGKQSDMMLDMLREIDDAWENKCDVQKFGVFVQKTTFINDANVERTRWDTIATFEEFSKRLTSNV